MTMDYQIIDETNTFVIGVGQLPECHTALPVDLLPKYFVVNKQHGVVEYVSEVFYFAKTWADQMEEALATLGKDIPVFPPPMIPDGRIN